MHEYSIINAMLDLCEEHAKQNGAKRVFKVRVAIGLLSGVEPQLLKSAFETFREGSICEGAEFLLDIKEVKIECRECKEVFEPKDNSYICPKCESIDIEIISGKEMHLMSLEME